MFGPPCKPILKAFASPFLFRIISKKGKMFSQGLKPLSHQITVLSLQARDQPREKTRQFGGHSDVDRGTEVRIYCPIYSWCLRASSLIRIYKALQVQGMELDLVTGRHIRGVGEMAQRFRALAVLPEVLSFQQPHGGSLVPSSSVQVHMQIEHSHT